MKTHLSLLLFAAVALTGAVSTVPVTPTRAESRAIHQQVDALLKPRRKPEALPVDPPNPFLLQAAPGAAVPRDPAAKTAEPSAGPSPGARDDLAGATSTELLARFSSRLRITGLIRLKDQVHVIINDSPWKEGDYIIVSREPRLVQLLVTRIQPGQLTLKLEDAELVLRF
jgi:hypothetical protein